MLHDFRSGLAGNVLKRQNLDEHESSSGRTHMEGEGRGSPPLPENALEKLLEKESYEPYKAFPNLFKATHGACVSQEAKSICPGAFLETALKSMMVWTMLKESRGRSGRSLAPGWPRDGEPRRDDPQHGVRKQDFMDRWHRGGSTLPLCSERDGRLLINVMAIKKLFSKGR